MVSVDGRTARHAHRRPELVEAAADWILENGATDVSLRRLGEGLGVTHAALIHHFGSKEQLFVEMVGTFRDRQRAAMAAAVQDAGELPLDELILATWKRLTSRGSLPMIRVVFELVGIGVRDPARVDGFLRDIVTDWTSSVRAVLVSRGADPARAEAQATWIYAGLRGLLLDLVTTRQRARVERGVHDFAAAVAAVQNKGVTS